MQSRCARRKRWRTNTKGMDRTYLGTFGTARTAANEARRSSSSIALEEETGNRARRSKTKKTINPNLQNKTTPWANALWVEPPSGTAQSAANVGAQRAFCCGRHSRRAPRFVKKRTRLDIFFIGPHHCRGVYSKYPGCNQLGSNRQAEWHRASQTSIRSGRFAVVATRGVRVAVIQQR